jgi:hypothetical protein
MANPLSHLEDAAEQLIEGTFARVFGARVQPIEVARRVARAMEDGQVVNAQGRIVVPNAYQVYLNPDDYAALEDYRDAMQDELARYVANLARRANATMPGRPRVYVQANAGISLRRVRVEARLHSARQRVNAPGHTQAMPSVHAPADAEQPRYALFDGQRRMPITEAVVTIGRGLDNDIILDNQHVSRSHAQLRRRYGQYVLYDLDSSGGTTVNNQPVRETPLQAGDLIAFAGVKVRFEQLGAVEPIDDPAAPRPTRPILRPRRKARS